MDDIDQAQRRAELVLDKQIEAARQGGGHMVGPDVCRCGEVNDRAAEGFAICSSCVGEDLSREVVSDLYSDGRFCK